MAVRCKNGAGVAMYTGGKFEAGFKAESVDVSTVTRLIQI